MSDITNRDLVELKRLAEDGRRLTLPGWEFALLWGTLVVLADTLSYAALRGTIVLPITAVWIAFIVLGWAGSMILGARLRRDPRAPALANRLTAATWISVGCGITACFVGVLVSNQVPGQIMVPIAHSGMGIAFGVLGALTGRRWLFLIALGWWTTVVAGFLMLDRVEILLLSAGGAMFLLVLPALALARAARDA